MAKIFSMALIWSTVYYDRKTAKTLHTRAVRLDLYFTQIQLRRIKLFEVESTTYSENMSIASAEEQRHTMMRLVLVYRASLQTCFKL